MALREELDQQGNFLFRYRSFFPFPMLLVAFFVFLQTETIADTNKNITLLEAFKDVFYLLVGIAGLIIRAYTVGHTPKNTSGRNTAQGQLADELNTTGIYSLVRHPLYVGNFLMWLGVALFTENTWFICSFVLFYWVYYERIMYAEEQFLTRKFGQRYTDWAAKTPAFIPGFANWQSPALKFSWKKVLRQEKNSLLFLFLCIFAFEVIGEYLVKRTIRTEEIIWSVATAGSILIYFILKYLKYKTKLLTEEGR